MPDIRALVRPALLLSLLVPALLLGGGAFAEDSYVLALTWQPAFCATHGASADCKLAAATGRPRLVLHGLWPDWDVNGDGHRNADDDYCVAAASTRKAILKLDAGDWLKLPPVQLSAASNTDLAAAMPGTAVGLERHEWWKHGTCSGLEAEDYFATAVVLMREVERGSFARLILAKAGGTVPRAELLAAFENDFGARSARALALDCAGKSGNAPLLEIRIRVKRTAVMQGLTAASLSVPPKPAKGNCPMQISITD